MQTKTSLTTLLKDHSTLTLAYAKMLLNQDAKLQLLLQADLRHCRLLHDLAKAGLDAGDFHLNLHASIFPLLGFSLDQQEDDTLYDFYSQLQQGYMKVPLKEFLEGVPQMAREIGVRTSLWKKELDPFKG